MYIAYIRTLRIQRMCCPVLRSCLSFMPGFLSSGLCRRLCKCRRDFFQHLPGPPARIRRGFAAFETSQVSNRNASNKMTLPPRRNIFELDDVIVSDIFLLNTARTDDADSQSRVRKKRRAIFDTQRDRSIPPEGMI